MPKVKIFLFTTLLVSWTDLFSEGHLESEENSEEVISQAIEMTYNANTALDKEDKPMSKQEGIAKSWVEAFYTSKEASRYMVTNHLAENGQAIADRYVGFGFMFNQDQNPGKMIITSIVPDSPASRILEVDDEFVSVNGVRVNAANMGKLAFRGKPGEEVRAIIKRQGKTQNISVARGKIEGSFSKTQIVNNIDQSESENWAPTDFNIIEVLSKENIVYVLHWSTRKDDISELPFEAYNLTRFTFNKEGMIEAYGSLSEDRFILEQQGYRISR